jgi:hypothetical protein
MTRGLEQSFVHDLKEGHLKPIYDTLTDPKLRLEIRGNYINIYYQGGNALKISKSKPGYRFEFDEKYCVGDTANLASSITDAIKSKDPYRVVSIFPLIFKSMDAFFNLHKKSERSFQHELINNHHQELNIVDIEYAGWNNDDRLFRLDMIGVVKIPTGYRLVILENKNGTGSIGGSAGVKKHYEDIVKILNDPKAISDLKQSVVNIIHNKHDLGLLDFTLDLDLLVETEILFVLVDFNERSKSLDNAVASIQKSIPAKVIFMTSEKPIIPYNEAKNLFQ